MLRAAVSQRNGEVRPPVAGFGSPEGEEPVIAPPAIVLNALEEGAALIAPFKLGRGNVETPHLQPKTRDEFGDFAALKVYAGAVQCKVGAPQFRTKGIYTHKNLRDLVVGERALEDVHAVYIRRRLATVAKCP